MLAYIGLQKNEMKHKIDSIMSWYRGCVLGTCRHVVALSTLGFYTTKDQDEVVKFAR